MQSFIDDGAHSLLCPLQRGPVVLFSKLQGDDLLFSRRQGSLKVNNLDGGLLSSHHEFGSQLAFSLTRTRDRLCGEGIFFNLRELSTETRLSGSSSCLGLGYFRPPLDVDGSKLIFGFVKLSCEVGLIGGCLLLRGR